MARANLKVSVTEVWDLESDLSDIVQAAEKGDLRELEQVITEAKELLLAKGWAVCEDCGEVFWPSDWGRTKEDGCPNCDDWEIEVRIATETTRFGHLLVRFGIVPFNPDEHGSRRCWWLGHDYNVYDLCKNCGRAIWMEQSNEPIPRILDRLWGRYWHFVAIWKIQVKPQLRVITRCNDCGKPEKVFRWRVGNHESCDSIPF